MRFIDQISQKLPRNGHSPFGWGRLRLQAEESRPGDPVLLW